MFVLSSSILSIILSTIILISSTSEVVSFVVFTFIRSLATSSISVPYESYPFIIDSNNVVPLPENGSNIIVPSVAYFFIAHLGISGINLQGYLK